jgi:hypothetical protein
VEAAYKQVPVRPADWPLLGFHWRGKWYYERVLPFGLKSSCRLWELYATALQRMMERIVGVSCVVHYVDDFLFVVNTLEAAQRHLTDTLALCASIGLPMAADKTEGPTQWLTFLGIELNTLAMTASLSARRLAEVRQLLLEWEGKEHATCDALESLVGRLQWCTQVIRPARPFLARIRAFMYAHMRIGPGPHKLNNEVREDIRWWSDIAPTWNGISLLYDLEWTQADKLELFTDACKEGLGGVFGDQWIARPWTRVERQRATTPHGVSMPFLELLALVLAAATWGSQWAARRVVFRSDCLPVVMAINQRRSHVPRMHELVRHLTVLAIRDSYDFRCDHIAGVKNVAADALSRGDAMWYVFKAALPNAREHASEIGTLPPFGSM